jgi:hypothetical protein
VCVSACLRACVCPVLQVATEETFVEADMEKAVAQAERKAELAKAMAMADLPITFPDPGKLLSDKKGFLSLRSPVVKMEGVQFAYPGSEGEPLIKDADFRCGVSTRYCPRSDAHNVRTGVQRVVVLDATIL